jgi:hypothetical protein
VARTVRNQRSEGVSPHGGGARRSPIVARSPCLFALPRSQTASRLTPAKWSGVTPRRHPPGAEGWEGRRISFPKGDPSGRIHWLRDPFRRATPGVHASRHYRPGGDSQSEMGLWVTLPVETRTRTPNVTDSDTDTRSRILPGFSPLSRRRRAAAPAGHRASRRRQSSHAAGGRRGKERAAKTERSSEWRGGGRRLPRPGPTPLDGRGVFESAAGAEEHHSLFAREPA